jgi:23S rRNA G2445 N2-methylase RlmL
MGKEIMSTFFALTFRGLETISAYEIAQLPGIYVEQVAYRRINGACGCSLRPLLNLRTVDDVFLHVATWSAIERQRSALATLHHLCRCLNLQTVDAINTEIRTLPIAPEFSVTVSFVGKRNYTTHEIKGAIADAIEQTFHWSYTTDDNQADLNLRLFMEHETVIVGVRLAKQPLHQRSYQRIIQAGSLKPPVAAAMLLAAKAHERSLILDPCCGSGTIVFEAAALGLKACGGDLQFSIRQTTQQNAQDVSIYFSQWDARTLPFQAASIGYIVSNLPWGEQVKCDDSIPALYKSLSVEIDRVTTPWSVAVLLTDKPQFLQFRTMHLADQFTLSMFGKTPSICIFRGTG